MHAIKLFRYVFVISAAWEVHARCDGKRCERLLQRSSSPMLLALDDDVSLVQLNLNVRYGKHEDQGVDLGGFGRPLHMPIMTETEEVNQYLKEEREKKILEARAAAKRSVEVSETSNHTTTTPDPATVPNSTFAQASEVKLNGAGDLEALLSSVQFDLGLILFCFAFFMLMVRKYPNLFAFRATGAWGQEQAADAPITWVAEERDWFKWVKVSYAVTCETMIHHSGLDAAFLIRFTVMAMEILAGIGVPNMLILGYLYCFHGGTAAGDDHLSYLGIGNVEVGKHTHIYWVVAFMTWYNVIFVQFRLFQWQRYFITFRKDWLLSTPPPRDCTILVEGIDDEFCSDAALKKYFGKIYGDHEILDAFVVKKISTLNGLIEEYKKVGQQVHELEHFMSKNTKAAMPRFLSGQPKLPFYQQRQRELDTAIKQEQRKVMAEAAKSPAESSVYATNGFVTFKTRRASQKALSTRLRADDGSFVMSVPPDPTDIIWSDLAMPAVERDALQFIGWGLIAGLFFAFMPIVLAISNLANIENIEKIPFMHSALAPGGFLESFKSTITGQLASLGLTFMMSMLPTFLMWIFNGFFYMKANRWAQLELQKFYFWFLVFFVLLTTSVGSSVFDFLSEMAQSPFMIFSILAEKMPLTTHFYMNYVVMQWVTHSMNITRYINVTKFFIFARFCDRERARALSEPEDQDYYGMGSRSARFTLIFIIGVVFGTICPLLCFFTFINFFLCRGIYGYLMNYAEQRKPDIGGLHWAEQMDHAHIGVVIYIILMTGILLQRATTIGPGVVSAVSFLWWAISYYKFSHSLHWESLAFEDVVIFETGRSGVTKRQATANFYRRPELMNSGKAMRQTTAKSYRQPELEADITQKV